MRICFIGSNGFLATTFGKLFDNADVYGTSAPKNYDYKYFCEFDVRNMNFGFDVFLKYDFIFLFSALGVQSGETNSSKDIFRVNTFFPIELFNYLSENHFQGILTTFGSYFEIGSNNQEIAFDEVDIINSNLKVPNDYCLSKRLLSKYIDSKKSSIRQWHFILPTIYGNGENSNRLIPYIINAISAKIKINLTSGLQVREYTNVSEIPKIISKALSINLSSGIYNIPGQERLSVKDLVFKIAHYYNYPSEKIQFGILDRKDTDMQYLSLNAKKLCNILQYQLTDSILDHIKNYSK